MLWEALIELEDCRGHNVFSGRASSRCLALAAPRHRLAVGRHIQGLGLSI
jgi:hypothetical protein